MSQATRKATTKATPRQPQGPMTLLDSIRLQVRRDAIERECERKQSIKWLFIAADGRWPEIFTYCGVADHIFDPAAKACPHCGKDRRRSFDLSTGFIVCGACKKLGITDGLDFVRWFRGWKFDKAVEQVTACLNANGGAQ